MAWGKEKGGPIGPPFSCRSLKRVAVFSGLASLWTSTLSCSLTVFDHLIECGLCILHERCVRRTTIPLRALLLSLIDGLRCFGFRHQDLTASLFVVPYVANAPPA